MAARDDGRKPLLVYLDPTVIRRLKMTALDRQTHAYLLVEEAVTRFLSSDDTAPSSPDDPSSDTERTDPS